MDKSERHYLNCQDENCEKAYCVDRREFTAKINRLQRPKPDMSISREIAEMEYNYDPECPACVNIGYLKCRKHGPGKATSDASKLTEKGRL